MRVKGAALFMAMLACCAPRLVQGQVIDIVDNALQSAGIGVDVVPTATDFAARGDADFKAARYQQAIVDWRHALVDDPKNGGIVLLLAQALFATGQYDEAAGAVQHAISTLPQDKWGLVVAKYKDLYGNYGDYTNELKALERARDAQPESPAIRFLLGYHFGFLGYPKQAVHELDKAIELMPKEEVAHKLRDHFQAQIKDSPPQPPTPSAEKPEGKSAAN